MKILIGCECSGVVRDAFIAAGHEAVSCDLQPSVRPGPHFQQDLLELLRMTRGYWDMAIFHPPCDYLATCAAWAFCDPDFTKYPGVGYHQRVKPGTLTGLKRRIAREDAVAFVFALWNCGIPKIAIENPVGVLSKRLGRPTQIIQPHQFGDDASKATCLWLKGLPPLAPTLNIPPRMVNGLPRWANQTDSGQNKLSPSDDRASVRAVTYQGIADAMPPQWGVGVNSGGIAAVTPEQRKAAASDGA